MNKYEICYRSWYGEQGKRNRPSVYYCKDGYQINSKTDEKINDAKCVDWEHRCEFLMPKKGKKIKMERPWKGDMI